jgi:hypothetical protein
MRWAHVKDSAFSFEHNHFGNDHDGTRLNMPMPEVECHACLSSMQGVPHDDHRPGRIRPTRGPVPPRDPQLCRAAGRAHRQQHQRDVVLEAGESHALDRDGPVFVQALDAALVLLPVLPRAQARADRLWRRLARAAFSA